jgi:LacI family transcriptional regulator
MEIEKDGKELFHEQLHAILMEQIRDGKLAPGQKIPSERVLSEMYGVSRTTAKAAVLRLLNDGLVVRATGKGTFISEDLGGKRLGGPETGNVAFVLNKRRSYRVPLVEDAVYLSLSQSIQEELAGRGMHFMSASIDDEDVGEVNSYKALLEKVDGVIIGEPRTLRLADLARAARRPVVFASPSEAHPPLDSVDIDNEQAGFEATRYLRSLGHERIAFVKGPESIAATQLRFEGYTRALENAGITPEESLIVAAAGWTIQDGTDAFETLRRNGAEFSAVVCSNDLLAIGVLRRAKQHGIAVPAALSVIGCDNIELSAHSDPPLTTMDNHILAIGRVAVRRLIERIEGEDGPEQRILFPASIVERDTCGSPQR